MWGAIVCRGLDFLGASVCGGLLAILDFGGLVCLRPKNNPVFPDSSKPIWLFQCYLYLIQIFGNVECCSKTQ